MRASTWRCWLTNCGLGKQLAGPFPWRRWPARAGLAALLLLLLAGPAWAARRRPNPSRPRAQSPTISLPDYLDRLDRARSLADSASSQPSPGAMQAVRQALGLPVDVAVPGGILSLASDPVLDNLTGTGSDDFLHASDHLAALQDAARAAQASPSPDRPRLAGALAAAYQGIAARPGWLARIGHDLLVILLSAWQWVSNLFKGIPGPSWLITGAALGVVGLIIVLVIRRVGGIVPERRVRQGGPRRAKAPDWDRLADEALARGDLAGAVRARYSALLAALASRGLIPQTSSVTAGETRAAVAGAEPDLYPAVERATGIFESTVFGHSPVERADVEALRQARESVGAR